jgi:methionyl-tRNA synthetase
MTERIFIAVAWPYANGSLHLGHIAGAYLPADIFARYHRLKGNQVLMVSGSDQHGTPITLKADQEGKKPEDIIDYYQREFCECWQKLGIGFDLFTGTHTKNHAAVSQEIFLKLLEKGHLFKDKVSQFFCPKDQRFLPDRYVEGTCPYCKTPGARGDQCDACGRTLNATELIKPYCRICHATPVLKDTEHFFFKLSAFQGQLEKWVEQQYHWRANVAGLTRRYLKEGLRDRAITRDIEWGVPVPVEGFEDKRLYVWFEAVIGYLSAAKQWAADISGDPEKWREFWEEKGAAKGYYFIGKDNIPFHTLIWPAILMGYGDLNLPYDVPANEFLTFENQKGSKSKNWAVWVPDYLSRYDPDPLRYVLSINMPETNDTDFSWREFVRRNNDELVATYGNLVNRVLTFVYKNFEGKVPEPGELTADDIELQNSSRETIKEMGEHLGKCEFKLSILRAMELAAAANRYLDAKSPWKTIKTDRAAAARALYTTMTAITQLKNILCPFMPFSSQKVNEYLGFDKEISGWQWQELPPGQKLNQPKPLFTKLEESIIEEETKRLGT